MTKILLILRGGIPLTVRGQNLNSVAEPIMVIILVVDGNVFTFYQVCNRTNCVLPPKYEYIKFLFFFLVCKRALLLSAGL